MVVSRRIASCILPLSLLSFQRQLPLSQALPTGAVTCEVGSAGVGGSHLAAANGVTTGLLSLETGMAVMLDDVILLEDTPMEVAANVPQTLSLMVVDDTTIFRGFNILLTATGDTIAEDSMTITDATNQKKNDLCINPTMGITHTNNLDKTLVELVLDLEAPLTYDLDVTVVVQNSNGISTYYYSRYPLVAVLQSDQAATTAAPTTIAPTTVAPTTFAPTISTTTTLSPTTIAPTTVAPTSVTTSVASATSTTLTPTTVTPTTAASATTFVPTLSPTTLLPTTAAPTSSTTTLGTITTTAATLLDILRDQGYTIFLEALETTGLVGLVAGISEYDYTIYAPTNTAFGSMDPELWSIWNQPNYTSHLQNAMARHLLQDQVYPASTRLSVPAWTLANDRITVEPFLIDAVAAIVSPDLVATNGIVQGIDTVLIAQESLSTIDQYLAASTAAADTTTSTTSTMAMDFSILLEFIELAGYTSLLQTTEVTLFAPTDDAFEMTYSQEELAVLKLPENVAIVQTLLDNHIVANNFPTQTLRGMPDITMNNGQVWPLSEDANGRLLIGPSGAVSLGEIFVRNGIVHPLSKVLVEVITEAPTVSAAPTVSPAPTPLGGITIMDELREEDSLTTFVSLLERTGLEDMLGVNDGILIYTVYAPDNAAFATMDPVVWASWNSDNYTAHLRHAMGRHIIVNNIFEADVAITNPVQTLFGAPIVVQPYFIDNTATINIPDVGNPGNGIAHGIDAVLVSVEAAWSIDAYLNFYYTEDFSILIDLYIVAGYQSPLLTQDGPHTMFAPDNRAFEEAFTTEELEALKLPENLGTLQALLQNHLTVGNFPDATLRGMSDLTMMNGEVFRLTETAVGELQIGLANVEEADIFLRNGMVHRVSHVLQPGATRAPTISPAPTTSSAPAVGSSEISAAPTPFNGCCGTIMDRLEGQPQEGDDGFETMVIALNRVGLDETLSDTTTRYTVYAPTNLAFSTLNKENGGADDGNEGLVSVWLSQNYSAHLQELLGRHIVPYEVLSANATVEDPGAFTLHGEPITVEPNLIDGIAAVTQPAMGGPAENGIVHGTDVVLLVPGMNNTLTESLTANPSFSIFLDLFQASNFAEVIQNWEVGPYTVFGPVDSAWEAAYTAEELVALKLPENNEELQLLMEHHVARGNFPLNDLSTIAEITMMSGQTLPVGSDGLSIGTATIIQYDSYWSYGILHTLSAVLEPSFTTAPASSPGGKTCDLCTGVAQRSIVSSKQQQTGSTDPSTVSIGDEVTVEGILMDTFCIDLGTLLDNPPLPTLQHADEHSVHCLVDVAVCTSTPFEVLLDPSPEDATRTFRRGYVLDDPSKEQMIEIARQVGVCNTCYGTGTVQAGFRARMTATVIELANAETGAGPLLSVNTAEAVLPGGSTGSDTSAASTSIPSEFWDLSLPDAPDLDCLSLEGLPLADGDVCIVFNEKYAYFCGCPGAPEPTCRLCEGGILPEEDKSVPAPDGDDLSCVEVDALFSVSNSTICEELRGQTEEFYVDIRAFCCPGGVAPNTCGTFCQDGTSVPDEKADVAVAWTTCKEADAVFPFITNTTECERLQSLNELCCEASSTTSSPTPAPADNVQTILEQRATLELFGDAVALLNIDKLLTDPDQDFTVFAPNNDGFRADTYLEQYTTHVSFWTEHLTAILENHIVDAAALSSQTLWSDYADQSLVSLAGDTLSVDAGNQLIGNRSIVVPDLAAYNGFVHEINGILYNPWRFTTILGVLQTETDGVSPQRRLQSDDQFSSLLDLIEENGLTAAMSEFSVNGTTLVAPTDPAIALGNIPSDTYGTLLYHVIGRNVYQEANEYPTFLAVSTSHPVADVLVTVAADGVLRFNNVPARTEFLAQNGLVQVSDQILVPPSMVEALGVTELHSDLEVEVLNELFLASGWNTANLSASLQPALDNRYTLVAPLDGVFQANGFTDTLLERLMTPWSQHIHHVLNSILISAPYTKDDLDSAGQAQTFETLGGATITFQSTPLRIDDGEILEPSPGCVDGIILFADDGMVIPEALSEDAYNYIVLNVPNATNFISAVEDVGLTDLISDSNAPVTVFTPPDPLSIPEETLRETLENHVFNDLYYLDQLQGLVGDTIQSANGKEWLVSDVGGTIQLSSGGESAVNVVSGANLVRNGIVYHLDSVLVDVIPALPTETTSPTAVTAFPSASPVATPTSPPSQVTASPLQAPTTDSPTQVPVSMPSATPGPSVSPVAVTPTPTISPTEQPTAIPIQGQNCNACDGDIIVEKSLPDGLSCGAWASSVAELEAGSDDCFLERAVGVEYCGCSAPSGARSCHPCPVTTSTALKLPDTRGLTCASLSSLVNVDPPTCDIIANKYSSWCGCPSPPEPVCSFCDSDVAQKPFIIPAEQNLTFYSRIFGHVANTSCQGFSNFYSVQTNSSCDSARSSLNTNIPYDMNAWCQCGNATPPKLCGDFCPIGAELRESLIVDPEQGVTCKEMSNIFTYISNESVCENTKQAQKLCCLTPTVTINTTFVVANQDGLSANDLAQNYGRTLNFAWRDFVNNLVSDTEGNQTGRLLRHRRLAATLVRNATEIFAVQNAAECPTDGANVPPPESNCQNVFGRFDLLAENEKPESVKNRYETAVEAAIENGKLQESFDKIDPNYPFSVVGVADPDPKPTPPDDDKEKISWWMIMLLSLMSVFGCVGFLFLIGYVLATRRMKKSPQQPPSEEIAPLTEASVRLLDAQDKPPVGMPATINLNHHSEEEERSSDDNEQRDIGADTSEEEDSEDWEDEDEEETRAVVEELSHHSDEFVDKTEERDRPPSPPMEQAPSVAVSIEDDDDKGEAGAEAEEWSGDEDEEGEQDAELWEEDSNENGDKNNEEEEESDGSDQGLDPPQARDGGLDPSEDHVGVDASASRRRSNLKILDPPDSEHQDSDDDDWDNEQASEVEPAEDEDWEDEHETEASPEEPPATKDESPNAVMDSEEEDAVVKTETSENSAPQEPVALGDEESRSQSSSEAHTEPLHTRRISEMEAALDAGLSADDGDGDEFDKNGDGDDDDIDNDDDQEGIEELQFELAGAEHRVSEDPWKELERDMQQQQQQSNSSEEGEEDQWEAGEGEGDNNQWEDEEGVGEDQWEDDEEGDHERGADPPPCGDPPAGDEWTDEDSAGEGWDDANEFASPEPDHEGQLA